MSVIPNLVFTQQTEFAKDESVTIDTIIDQALEDINKNLFCPIYEKNTVLFAHRANIGNIASYFNISTEKAINYKNNIIYAFRPYIEREMKNPQRMLRVIAKTENALVKMEIKLKSLPPHGKRTAKQIEVARELYNNLCKAASIITYYNLEINRV
jgi:hypothetical protein|tara:strand:- start:4264 stop:4728 length:465 start_codon:yes stop_codon:yes gene_type:complete